MNLEQLKLQLQQALQQSQNNATEAALDSNSGEQLCALVSTACNDDEFVTQNLQTRKPGENVREVLYEDAELGFCICGHVYDNPDVGKPHDHGSSWAIYGQAEGATEMSDWKIVQQESETLYVEKTKTYTMTRGDTHLYNVGDVHAPVRTAPVKLLRIEGVNLDNVKRSVIEPADSRN